MLITARSNSPHAMEGAKTIAYEICQQLHDEAPDVGYVPVGGGLLSSIWKGFKEWRRAGSIARLPRMVAVQPLGCDPVTRAWQSGRPIEPLEDCISAASGIILTSPHDGWALSIADDVTYEAQAELASHEGLFVEPAAAKADRQSGRLNRDEKVVGILTGIGVKDSAAVQRMADDKPLPMIESNEILRIKPD